jgi:hypothetical protein
VARRRAELGAELTRDGRPDEALGFTAAGLLAWLEIDRQQAEQQCSWLRRQRAELGDERFTQLLAEYVEDGLLVALLEISMPSATRLSSVDIAAASAEVDPGEARGGDGTQNGQ